jgi:hypothetical protein
LPVRENRPERPQRALGRSYYTEWVSIAKEVCGFPWPSATHRGAGKGVERENGAAHDRKKTAAQRLSTTPVRGRTTLLAEAKESRIRVLGRPVFLLMTPGLPFGFERVDIPPKGEGFGPFVGRGLQAHLKEVQLFFLVLQFGVNRQAFFGLKDLEHHPLDGPAFFFQLHAYPEPSPCRIVVDLLHCWF